MSIRTCIFAFFSTLSFVQPLWADETSDPHWIPAQEVLAGESCPLTGVFQSTSEIQPTLLRFAPRTIRLASSSTEEAVQVYKFIHNGAEYLNISMKLEIVDNDEAIQCIAAHYPSIPAQKFAPQEARLSFFESIPGLDVSLQGGESIDIFGMEHWINLTIGSRDLVKYSGSDSSNLIRILLAGTVDWYVPGEPPIKQSILFTEEALEHIVDKIGVKRASKSKL